MLAVSGLAVWLLPLGCGRPADCVPLDAVPMVDPGRLLDDPAALRHALTRAGGWFQAEPCVAQVELRSEIRFDGADFGGRYNVAEASVDLVLGWDQQIVTHELCHAADYDRDWVSYTQRAAWSDVALAACLNCTDSRMRLIETLAQRCQLGPRPTRLGSAIAGVCPEVVTGPDSLDQLLSEELLANDGLDAEIASVVGPISGSQLDQRWTMASVHSMRHGPDGLYLLGRAAGSDALVSDGLLDAEGQATDGLVLPLLADQGPVMALFPVDPSGGVQAGTRPWAGQGGIDGLSLSGGSPLVVWGWVDGLAQRAWLMDGWGDWQELAGPCVAFSVAAASGDVVLGNVEDGLIHLRRWAPSDGSLTELALPDDLAQAAGLLSITARSGGWLVTVKADRRAWALWLEADGSWSRRESLPGTWELSQVSQTDTGLAMRWSLGQADWVGDAGAMMGAATWSPDQGWQIDVLACDADWASLAWSGDQLVAIWDEGELKLSELRAREKIILANT